MGGQCGKVEDGEREGGGRGLRETAKLSRGGVAMR